MSARVFDDALLGALRARAEEALRASLDAPADGVRAAPERLREAMRYSLLAGGKRLRPVLALACADAARGAVDDAVPAAVAVEYVHTYSLIHDDLPALDDDDMRRGRPTLHKAFDEATAILAGDALLTDAFAVLSGAPRNAAAQVRELAYAAGSAGMVGGQVDDVAHTGRDVETLADVHARKTGRLFVAACALGGLAAGASDDVVTSLRDFGRHFGLAFQIADDVLDVTGGRGRDAKNERVTFATLLGVDAARARARESASAAVAAADALAAPALRALASFAAARDH